VAWVKAREEQMRKIIEGAVCISPSTTPRRAQRLRIKPDGRGRRDRPWHRVDNRALSILASGRRRLLLSTASCREHFQALQAVHLSP